MTMEKLRAEMTAFFQKLYIDQQKVLVFGEGPLHARLMLIGEAPGEQESLQGRPFVGKAGRNLDACKGFLRAQVALVRPKIIVLLGSTAGKAVLGDQFRVTRDRGRWVEKKGVWFMPTYHPSALLRDETLKRPAWEDFKAVREKIRELSGE